MVEISKRSEIIFFIDVYVVIVVDILRVYVGSAFLCSALWA